MTTDIHAARKAAVYAAALQLIAQGVSPAAMKIQQLADAAGIGKGTVYEYFASKEEIMQGLATYCFESENTRIRALFADCTTLRGLVDRTVDYLQDIAANRMGTYKVIAQTLGKPRCDGPMSQCTDELKGIICPLLAQLQANGEIDPEVSIAYCCTVLFSTVLGGLAGLCYTAAFAPADTALPGNLREMLYRTMAKR